MLSKTSFGDFELYTIHTGFFRLDGGAMFGVVPKTLWSKYITPDEKNRIPMCVRCLLVKSNVSGRIYLIDNGVGNKFDEKYSELYDLDYSEWNLDKALEFHGFSREDITDMVFTHLHFDHCGGSTNFDENGNATLQFPNAKFWVTKDQWVNATAPNAREKASYFPENLSPLAASGRMNLVDGAHEFETGFSTLIVNGHSLGQQLPYLENNGKRLVFCADLLPTYAHVPLPWVMGYDMQPLETLKEKQTFLEEASSKEWFLYLEHDAHFEIITVSYNGKKFSVDQKLSLSDLK